jgi:outer membrane protein assembly factor BamB
MAIGTVRIALITALVVSLLSGCGGRTHRTWPVASGDLAGTRAASGSAIGGDNVAGLHIRWQFPLTAKRRLSGVFASNPVVDEDTVYVQDLRSNVFALNRSTGTVRWAQRFRTSKATPNGVVVDGGRVYGATDADAFALSASNGRELWYVQLANKHEQLADVAPVAWNGLVFMSTVSDAPLGRGAIYALDAATGTVRWKFVTVAHGGGLSYPVSIDELGHLYTVNAGSLLVLDAATGHRLWRDQVTPHHPRGYDFQTTPILATRSGNDIVFGAAMAGRVVAWNRATHRRLWNVALRKHRVRVCAGPIGGIATPMAYADGRLFVPVVDLCGEGRLVTLDAGTGRTLWQRRLPSPDFGCATVSNNVVFTSTLDGNVYGLSVEDGELLWHARVGAGGHACPAVAGDTLLVDSAVRRPGGRGPALVAFAP